MRRLFGIFLALAALARPAWAQDPTASSSTICEFCKGIFVSDTSSSPGFEAKARRTTIVNSARALVFIGTDHHVRFAQWTGSAWGIEVVDGTAQAAGLAMDFDDAGQPIVSYHDGAGGVVFARHNAAGWDVQTIFPGLGVTGPTSLAHIPGTTGIACVSSSSNMLFYLQQAGGGPWTMEPVASVLPGAGDPSLVLALGARAIAYRDGSPGMLSIATSGDSPPWQAQVVDGLPGTGDWASLIGHAGDYGIAYHDHPDHQLRYAHQIPGGWAIDIVDGLGARVVGRACAAVELGNSASGPVGIAYRDLGSADLDYASGAGPSWGRTWLDQQGDVGGTLACGIDVSGTADTVSIVYSTSTGDLKYYGRAAAVASVASSAVRGPMHATWRNDATHAGGTVSFIMPATGPARVTILDAQGRRVAEPLARELTAGPAEVAWDARDVSGQRVAAGVYFALVHVPGASAGVRGIVLH